MVLLYCLQSGKYSTTKHDVRETQAYRGKLQELRKVNIHKYCRSAVVPKPSATGSVTLVQNSKFNVSYFGIPKIASTFIKQMFFVLKYGPTYAKENFSIPRNEVHKHFKGQRKDFVFNNTLDETVTIVPVRNPYSRLFSAFIDKVFLPNSIKLVSHILASKQNNITYNSANYTLTNREDYNGLSVTFLDFLNYVIDPHQKKKVLIDHYGPCFPRLKYLICNSNHYIVAKQETFEKDIKYVLQLAGVNQTEHETYNIIIKSLHESRVEDSIPGIIKVTFAHAERDAKLWTGNIVAERLWHSFQIQGYIDEQYPYPKTYFNFELTYSNVSFVLNVFLNVMKRNKLSRARSWKQRQEALLSAYKGLPKDVIQKVNDMYNSDFKAFGYSKTLF